jgi:hypothetical protein
VGGYFEVTFFFVDLYTTALRRFSSVLKLFMIMCCLTVCTERYLYTSYSSEDEQIGVVGGRNNARAGIVPGDITTSTVASLFMPTGIDKRTESF